MSGGYPIKLVRDDIAKVIPNVGDGEVYFAPVGRTTHLRLLKQKLVEEVGEYLTEPSLGELADILEVVEALARVDRGAGPQELRAEKLRKLRERGGFMRGTVMFARETPTPEPNHDPVGGERPVSRCWNCGARLASAHKDTCHLAYGMVSRANCQPPVTDGGDGR